MTPDTFRTAMALVTALRGRIPALEAGGAFTDLDVDATALRLAVELVTKDVEWDVMPTDAETRPNVGEATVSGMTLAMGVFTLAALVHEAVEVGAAMSGVPADKIWAEVVAKLQPVLFAGEEHP